ncbi:MAG: hypothetical protein FWJ70_06335 [Micromonosporaceae bacterium]|jgi:hypothetical protein
MGTTTTPDRTGAAGASAHRLAEILRRHPLAIDLGVVLLYSVGAVWLLKGLWPDPAHRTLSLNPEDQILIEWFLAVDTRVLTFDHGLVSDRLNAPDGVNLLANATSLTLGTLLAPVTLTLGAPVSFAVLTAGNLAATAAAWYLLLSRTFRLDRTAAAVGGAFCGFAPAMISHSNSHWHMTSQWLVPAIVWSVVRMARAAEAGNRRRAVTSGLWLAGLVVVQVFLGEEVLYLTALSLLLFAGTYAALRREWARRVAPLFLTGGAVAVAVASVVLAYPLWVQFRGPGSVPNGPFPPHYYSADLLSFVTFSPLSIAGSPAAGRLATGPAEYNTFLGWPLLLVAAAATVWLRRRPAVLALAVTGVVMGVLSLGPELVVNGQRPGLSLPYQMLVDVPVIDGALPQRYAMALVPVIAVVLALALHRARRETGRARVALPVAVTVALLPLVPTPLPTEPRSPVPQFVSEGHWRQCVEPGGVLVPVPPPTPRSPEAMRWAAAAHAHFALPEGFFIGPYGARGRASVGTYKLPTSQLLAEVAETGRMPELTEEHRRQAQRDLAHWGAQCVVLGTGQQHETQLREVLGHLLGPGERIADVWVWRP